MNQRKSEKQNFSKQGQITLFIILGLLILITFTFTFYIGSILTKRESTQTVVNQIEDVENIINGCFSQAITEALIQLGKQGGVLYQTQGGITIPTSSPITQKTKKHTRQDTQYFHQKEKYPDSSSQNHQNTPTTTFQLLQLIYSQERPTTYSQDIMDKTIYLPSTKQT